MRRYSKKRAAHNAKCQPIRDQLKQEVGHCEVCRSRFELCCHEILRGTHRAKSLDKRYAILVVCFPCHMMRIHRNTNESWPEARQLAVLRRSRPADYDLAAFLKLKNPNAPNAITQDEVDAW